MIDWTTLRATADRASAKLHAFSSVANERARGASVSRAVAIQRAHAVSAGADLFNALSEVDARVNAALVEEVERRELRGYVATTLDMLRRQIPLVEEGLVGPADLFLLAVQVTQFAQRAQYADGTGVRGTVPATERDDSERGAA